MANVGTDTRVPRRHLYGAIFPGGLAVFAATMILFGALPAGSWYVVIAMGLLSISHLIEIVRFRRRRRSP